MGIASSGRVGCTGGLTIPRVFRRGTRHGAQLVGITPMAQLSNRRTVSTVSRAYSSDPHETIESIAGVNSDRTRWLYSQAVAISRIESGTDAFVVSTGDTRGRLVVHAHGGQKYLRIESGVAA